MELMELDDFLNRMRIDTLFINTSGKRPRGSHKDFDDAEHLWIRHETYHNLVYFKASAFERLVLSPAVKAFWFGSLRYQGCVNKQFYAGTEYPRQVVRCHLFDMNASPAQRKTSIPAHIETQHRNYLKKKHYGDLKLIARDLEIWRQSYGKPKEAKRRSRKREGTTYQTQQQRKMLKTRIEEMEMKLSAIEGWAREVKEKAKEVKRGTEDGVDNQLIGFFEALSMRILASQTAEHVAKPEKRSTKLDEISTYIKENKPNIRTSITRITIDPDTQRPALSTTNYDPRDHGLETVGRYVENINLDGSGHKRKLYLHTVPLKYAVPNYQEDIRYTHGQHFKLHSHPGASGLYTAVFDLKKGGAK